jgi:predicted PurR-regulated permease PerM
MRQTVALPPALGLFAVVGFGLVFGFLGVLLASPLAVAALVAVKGLWLREALGAETELPGEAEQREA